MIHYIGRDAVWLTLSQSLIARLSWSRSLVKTMDVLALEDPVFYLSKGKEAAAHRWPKANLCLFQEV